VYQSQCTDVAFAYHYGSEDSIGTIYRAMSAWVAAQGYQLSAAKREIYWPAPENKDETSSLTEIQFPVTRSRSAARRLREKAS
jgi:effector-binding domain-containing protein